MGIAILRMHARKNVSWGPTSSSTAAPARIGLLNSRIPHPSRSLLLPQLKCQPEGVGFDSVNVAVQEKDVLASASTFLQQQLPADSSLQQLLEPLIPANNVAGADDSGAPCIPGEDIAAISAASTSLAKNAQSPDAVVAAVAVAAVSAAAASPPIDVEAHEVPRSWRQTPVLVQQPAVEDAEELPQTADQQRQEQKSWVKVVGVCGFAALLCYLDRTNISTAIVPMAQQFGWNKQFCSIVMSAFFAGYGATQVWGGQLSDRYGGSTVLAAGLFIWSLATILTPLAASWGTWQLLTARTVLGMAQGIAFPAVHALLAKKVPNKVRSGAIGIIMALAHCGTAIGFGASPGLIETLGWGSSFYLFGGAALLWVPMWLHMARETGNRAARTAAAAILHMQRQQVETKAAMVAAAATAVCQSSNNIVSSAGLSFSRPAEQQALQPLQTASEQDQPATTANHPILVGLEQQQLQAARAQADAVAEHPTSQQPNPNVGFWPLMRRKEVWAIAVAQYTAGWGFYGLLAWLPQFFMEHCGLQLSQLGGFTLAPYVLQALMGASAGLLADDLIQKHRWRVRDVRVLMQVAGMAGPAACLFAAASPLSSHSPYVAAGLITLAMGLSALTCSGVSASHLDIAPRHAGVVFGFGNTAGTLAGLVAVPGLGYVLQQTGSWPLAFGLAALHNVIGAAVWACWVGDRPLPEDGAEEDVKQQSVFSRSQPQPPLALPTASGGGDVELAGLKLKTA